jgi:hypothetical protein
MLDMIQSWRSKHALKKQLLTFLDEMEQNLEIYYVTDQRQFMTGGFIMAAWDKVKNIEVIQRHESIKIYATTLLDFNKSYKEFKEYEQWYSSDMNNKSTENAKKLHALKAELDLNLKTLEAIIIPAGQALEQELLNLGFISH